MERVNYYTDMLTEFGQPHVAYIAMLADFMRNRAEFLRWEMVEQLHFSDPYTCDVQIQGGGGQVLVDGYPYEQNYRGSYFEGQRIILE